MWGDLKEQQTVILIFITIDRIDWFGSDRLTHLLSGLGIRVALHEGHEEEKGTDGHGIVGGLLGYCLTKRWLDVGARPHDASQSYPTIYGGSHKEETEQTKSAKRKETILQLAPAVTTLEMHLISCPTWDTSSSRRCGMSVSRLASARWGSRRATGYRMISCRAALCICLSNSQGYETFWVVIWKRNAREISINHQKNITQKRD